MYSMPMGIDAQQRVADLMNSKGKVKDDLHWDEMAEMLSEILLNDRLKQDVRQYATSIIDCLYSFCMQDPFLVTQAIDILSALRDFQMEDALDTEDHELLYRVNGVDLKPPRVAKLCDEIYERRKASERFNYNPKLDFEAVSRAMAAGDTDVMKNLVKYGVSLESPVFKEGKYFQRICAMMMHNNISSNSHQHRMLSWIAETTVKRIYRRKIPPYNYQKLLKFLPGIKRILLVRAIVQIIARQEELENGAEKKMKLEPFLYFVDCFKLFCETNTEPFLSLQELRAYFRQDVPELKNFTAAKIEELFHRYFKEWPQTYEPRSLKHLCRCRIRYEVRKNSELLPIKAQSLQLPRILLRYVLADKIKLQKDDDLLSRMKPFLPSCLHLSPSPFDPVPPPNETYTISSDEDS